MTEIRLTFAAEGFEAVSKVLVEMGIGFQVEPIAATPKKEAAPAVEAPPPAKKRAPAKPARKASKPKRAARGQKPASDDAAAPAAERLRAAIARSGTAYRSPLEPPAGGEPVGPAGDRPVGQPGGPGDK